MQQYLSAQPIDFTIPLGGAVATEVKWLLKDETETEIASGTVIPEATDTTVTVSLTAEQSTITNGSHQEVRELNVTLVYANGQATQQEVFLLVSEQSLMIGVNSAVTHLQALRLYPTFPTFAAFGAVSDEQRKNALIAAWRNIGLIELAERAMTDKDGNVLQTENGDHIWSTELLTPELFNQLHPQIIKDLRAAQLEEAEFLLGGDGIEDLRSRGVMSYTVGEVKQFFRTSKPIELVVSKHALRYLGKYAQYHRRITRV